MTPLQLLHHNNSDLVKEFIRIAEPVELADSVKVWGDVGSAGRYIIPRGLLYLICLPIVWSADITPGSQQSGNGSGN